MFRQLKTCALAGFVMSSLASYGTGAEGTVFHFDDWKVIVTPGPSTSARQQSTVEATSTKDGHPSINAAKKPRFVVQPVSYKQEETTPPAPVPAELAKEPQPTSTPSPIEILSPTPTPLPQSVISSGPSIAVESCCDLPVITPRTTDPFLRRTVVVPQTAMYRDIYFSIPFSRSEFNANPSYRHDATMEFLFNQMRPTVIQRSTSNVYHYDYGYMQPNYGFPFPYRASPYPFGYGLRVHHSPD